MLSWMRASVEAMSCTWRQGHNVEKVRSDGLQHDKCSVLKYLHDVQNLLWIAEKGLVAKLPDNWKPWCVL
jgi:hypothetical protein